MAAKTRQHNEWFRSVMPSRKTCPTCKAKLGVSRIWSWGNYLYGKWRTVDYCCEHCFSETVASRLTDHAADCGCSINLIGYQGEKLPDCFTLALPVLS